ncbi:hypothetical protein PINS_up004969 [Pythium insidiosum]|nr:hypothetical protein PINS_up004969 [Pythium insidiosum]
MDKLTTPSGDNAHHQPPAARQSQNDEGVTEDLMHGINSFWAIVFPVCITMILASVVVVNYRNKNIEASMQTYLVFGAAEEQSGAEQIGLSLVNALVIIGAIAVLTFVMVLLYKFNCLKFLTGYIMFASAAILSFVGGQLVDSIINDQLKWAVDWPSFLFVMINFGFVGVVAIFYQKGIPKFIQNGYLVLVSVILAWQFSMWPEWTTYIFCFMFAIYDLCAVLTPCGPLKCLIGMIQEKQAPLPGLIYEADVRDGVGNRPAAAAAPAQSRSAPAATRSAPSDAASTQVQTSSAARPPKSLAHSSSTTGSSSSTQSSRSPIREDPTAASSLQMSGPTSQAARGDASAPTRPRNVAESDFTTHDCETMEELVALLQGFLSHV